MKHGFKAKAERLSERVRKKLGIPVDHPLPARQLVVVMDVTLLGAEDIPGLDPRHVNHLLRADVSSWSAVTMEANDRRFIIHNTSHAPTRQESNIMHEAAHILCEHPPGEIVRYGPFSLRRYDRDQEEEAEWLGAVLQIPRKGLLRLARDRVPVSAIAQHFGASEDMVNFRLYKGGVRKQLWHERRKRSR